MTSVSPAQFRQEPSKSGLRILLLGPMLVELDGEPVAIAARRGRALLGYLVQRGGTEIARGLLTGLLWGERGEEQARASLRQTLSELRAALGAAGAEAIIASKESVVWARGAAFVDAEVVESAAESGDAETLRQAASLLRGEFMEGLEVEEAAFEHWLAAERERFRGLACRIHLGLMEQAAQAGSAAEALQEGQRLLALDPLQEHVHRTLMRLYLAQGRHDAALAQYERCRRDLAAQLGVQPDAETEQLAKAIKASRRDGPPRTQPSPAPPIQAKLSIAVLPFLNLSDDRQQDFFADGMTEDIIGALSRLRELLVISRSSSFAYRGRTIRAQEAAAELGVAYLLEGSVRVAGGRVRVGAQLIDGASGGQVWTERYEGGLDDIFAVQDEITRSIAVALQVKLTQGESARLWEGQTKNLRAWESMVLARDAFNRYSLADNHMAHQLLESAIAADPAYTSAMALLGISHYWDARYSVDVDEAQAMAAADFQLQKIAAIDADLGAADLLRGVLAFMRRDYDAAIMACRRTAERAPSDARALGFLGFMHLYAGETDKAVLLTRAAMRLCPQPDSWMVYYHLLAEFWAGNIAVALEGGAHYLRLDPGEPYGLAYLAAIHASQQEDGKARESIALLRRKAPDFGIRNILRSERYREPEKLDWLVAALKRAGLPD